MHTNFLRAIALGLVLSGFIGCSDEQAGEEAPPISQEAINDAAPDNATTGDPPVDPVQVPETGASCEVIPLDLPGPDYDARLIPIESAASKSSRGLSTPAARFTGFLAHPLWRRLPTPSASKTWKEAPTATRDPGFAPARAPSPWSKLSSPTPMERSTWRWGGSSSWGW